MIHKDYRGKGFISGLFQYSSHLSNEFSYASVLGRIALTARASLPTLRAGGELLGFIPKSVRISSFGWVPDIISYTDSTHIMTRSDVDAVSLNFYIRIQTVQYANFKT